MLRPRLAATALALALPLAATACSAATVEATSGLELREGQVVAEPEPTPLYTPDFVVRGMAAGPGELYLSGLRFPEDRETTTGEAPSGVIVKVPLLGPPETLVEGDFVPMTTLRLIDGRLYWHERHDSPAGPGLRALAIDGGDIERVSELAGHSWAITPDAVYFTRPDDEIDEGGFYVLKRGASKPKLVVRRRGVVRTVLLDDDEQLYWTTRQRRDGTWAVFAWDGANSGKEVLSSDETFASLGVDGEDFLWVTWAEDDGAPLHSLYRRPIAGGDTQVLARKRGLPGFMEVFADPRHVYLTTVRGGELRRLAKGGGEVEVLAGSGDRQVVSNRFNLFWVAEAGVFWMGK